MHVHSSFNLQACQRSDSVRIKRGITNAMFLRVTLHISEPH